jgi:dTDP-4-amino-4,6-dideoxygalactose transaminase
MHSLREYGWRRRYLSTEFGVNSRLDELQAAILRVKLPSLQEENKHRQRIADLYDARLAGGGIVTPRRAPGAEHVFHQYVVQATDRDRLQKALADAGIGTLVHYPAAIHQQPAYDEPAFRPVDLSNTESVVRRILSLPMFPELTADHAERVCAEILRCIR